MHEKHIHYFPPALILLFFLLSFTPRVQQNEVLLNTFLSLSALLVLMYVITLFVITKRGFQPQTKTVIVKAHYVQMTMHLSIFAYWGWYWDQVYEQTVLILGQLVFVHVF